MFACGEHDIVPKPVRHRNKFLIKEYALINGSPAPFGTGKVRWWTDPLVVDGPSQGRGLNESSLEFFSVFCQGRMLVQASVLKVTQMQSIVLI